jgi:hypothetical protein
MSVRKMISLLRYERNRVKRGNLSGMMCCAMDMRLFRQGRDPFM